MSDIDYDSWIDFILRGVTARGWQGGSVLDIGCGTANSTFPVFARGFEVMGLDASAAMLEVAREKLPPVSFIEASFLDFSIPKQFSLIYSVFDSLNNLLEPKDFLQACRTIYEHLCPAGFFVFDVNTTIGLRDLWESGRAEGWVNDVYYRWEHHFDEGTGLASVEAYCETGQRAFTEVHFERPYDAGEVRELLQQAGFSAVEALNYPDGEPAPEDASRIWIMAQK